MPKLAPIFNFTQYTYICMYAQSDIFFKARKVNKLT